MKILFTTVCNDDYALGGQVMLYSMRENIKNWQDCDFKIYHNKDFAHLSRENQAIFKKIMPDIIFEHVDKECYFDSKVPPAGNRAQGCKAAYLTLESFNETEYDKVIMLIPIVGLSVIMLIISFYPMPLFSLASIASHCLLNSQQYIHAILGGATWAYSNMGVEKYSGSFIS